MFGPQQSRWWREDDPSGHLTTSVAGIDRSCAWRQRSLTCAYRLYTDVPMEGFAPGQFARVDTGAPPLAYNVVRSVSDTIHAEIVQSRPRPMFLTEGADWEAGQRAPKLGKFCEGVFYGAGGDEETSAAARDAIVFGTGMVKIFDDEDEVCIERVLPGEIFVDAYDGREGRPRCMYQVKYVDRYVLAARYPNEADYIESAASAGSWLRDSSSALVDYDLIPVVEAWHLPSGKKAKDGRHVIVIFGKTLLDEDWEDQRFPFAKLHWTAPPIGFWSSGIADQLAGLQAEINALLTTIQQATVMLGAPYILTTDGAVPTGHLDPEVGRVVSVSPGMPAPTIVAASYVPKDLYDQMDRYYAKAFELSGVSALAAMSQKPSGLDSGKALRTYADIQSKRFLVFGRAWEEFHIDIATLTVACARRIAKRKPEFSVVYRDKSNVETIAWEDVELDEDKYVLRCFPVSALGSTPAGQLATLRDMFVDQIIDQKTFARLSGIPDLDTEQELENAPMDRIRQALDDMISSGEYVQPDPFFDLQAAKSTADKFVNLCSVRKVPDERIQLIRTFSEECKALLDSLQPPPPPPGPPPPDAGMDPSMMPPPGAA